MNLILLLFGLGIVFMAVEVLVPGGILGAIGALLMIGGCAAAFSQFGSTGGWIATAGALVLASAALYIEFRILPHTRIGKRAFLTSEITATSSTFGEQAAGLIGKSAEAATLLSPTGYVRIDGRQYEAFSPAGQIPPGTALHVVGADNFRLIVSPTQPHTA